MCNADFLTILSIVYNALTMNEKYFLQRTEPLDNEAFVEEVYRAYLKRDSDADGKSLFLHKL